VYNEEKEKEFLEEAGSEEERWEMGKGKGDLKFSDSPSSFQTSTNIEQNNIYFFLMRERVWKGERLISSNLINYRVTHCNSL
jgi:hypothetical protein